MIKRSFIGFTKPLIAYDALESAPPEPKQIQTPKKITLFIDTPYNYKDSLLLNIGDNVKTGQRLSYSEDNDAYVIASATGTISSITSILGDYGKSYTAVTIDTNETEEMDDHFTALRKDPTFDTAKNYLDSMPGKPSFNRFIDSENSIDTIIICGMDADLYIKTNQYILKAELEAIANGIRILKDITQVDHVIIAVPESLMQDAILLGTEVRTVNTEYPAALPHLMVKSFTGQAVPVGKDFGDIGICFFTAEAVASIGKTFANGSIPVTKTFTFIDKNEIKTLVSAKIGTTVSEILDAFDITLDEKDRIIFGGPMTGSAIYSADYPILPDTDAIIVQARDKLDYISDYPCINCGDCVRSCPANIPVNMLVRLLEAGQYEEASDQYDLYSCIECGLCSYVCVSKIPVFHYIKLAKYELDLTRTAEATNA
ncbi:MAG: 4Fe-4S dicluster domain-containing protein [Desulfobacterales bacterium]|nr:MAG: 4Fe-4S dicluster domain-containing protein [Desulfobacterales bacterium]